MFKLKRKNKKISLLELCDCEIAAIEKISSHNNRLTVKHISKVFKDLIKQGKGDYNINICGSEDYYLYIINDKEKKLISIDTSPDEFEDYLNKY